MKMKSKVFLIFFFCLFFFSTLNINNAILFKSGNSYNNDFSIPQYYNHYATVNNVTSTYQTPTGARWWNFEFKTYTTSLGFYSYNFLKLDGEIPYFYNFYCTNCIGTPYGKVNITNNEIRFSHNTLSQGTKHHEIFFPFSITNIIPYSLYVNSSIYNYNDYINIQNVSFECKINNNTIDNINFIIWSMNNLGVNYTYTQQILGDCGINEYNTIEINNINNISNGIGFLIYDNAVDYEVYIKNIIINGKNSIPEFDLTIEKNACYNLTTKTFPINISAYDLEDDKIYYSLNSFTTDYLITDYYNDFTGDFFNTPNVITNGTIYIGTWEQILFNNFQFKINDYIDIKVLDIFDTYLTNFGTYPEDLIILTNNPITNNTYINIDFELNINSEFALSIIYDKTIKNNISFKTDNNRMYVYKDNILFYNDTYDDWYFNTVIINDSEICFSSAITNKKCSNHNIDLFNKISINNIKFSNIDDKLRIFNIWIRGGIENIIPSFSENKPEVLNINSLGLKKIRLFVSDEYHLNNYSNYKDYDINIIKCDLFTEDIKNPLGINTDIRNMFGLIKTLSKNMCGITNNIIHGVSNNNYIDTCATFMWIIIFIILLVSIIMATMISISIRRLEFLFPISMILTLPFTLIGNLFVDFTINIYIIVGLCFSFGMIIILRLLFISDNYGTFSNEVKK